MRCIILLGLATLAYNFPDLGNLFNFGERIHDYRFEYHRRENLLLIRNSTACIIVDADKSIADRLEHRESREQLEDELYMQIKQNTGETVAKLTDLRETYHDNRAVFECFRHDVLKLTYMTS